MALGHCWHFYPLGPTRLQLQLSLGLLLLGKQSLQALVSLASGIAICTCRISFLHILQDIARTLCPSGQDPAGVGNAGPNPRHQTSALGWQTGPVFSDPRFQPLLHELIRSVSILCIFFMNTCAPGRHGGRRLGMPGRRAAGDSAGCHPSHGM